MTKSGTERDIEKSPENEYVSDFVRRLFGRKLGDFLRMILEVIRGDLVKD